jgi:hypothetical protein
VFEGEGQGAANLLEAPEIQALLAALMRALEPFAAARVAVAEALSRRA